MSSIYRSLLNGFKNLFNHSPFFSRLHIPGNNILSPFIFIIVLCIHGNLSAQITRKVLKTNELIKSTKAPEVSKPTILRDYHPIRLDMSSATLKNDFAALTNGDYSVISLVLPGSDKASDYYVKKSGSKLILNGDIVVKDFNILSTKSATINDMTPALGVNQLYRWPNGTVPVVLDPSVFVDDKYIIIKSALDFFNFHTGIIFKERGDEDNYLVIKCVNDDTGKGGSTEVGRQIYGSNILQLVNGKFDEGTVLHELMHTLGVLHEQARTDRDNYIEIKWDNIKEGAKKNYQTEGNSTIKSSYDYCSIMQYPEFSNGFAIDPDKPTIICKSNGMVIPCPDCMGNRTALTQMDKDGLDRLYGEIGISRFPSQTPFTSSKVPIA